MGRPKEFTREKVMDQAIQIFWRNGFADTSVQDLERATGVNKSGLYAEFKDKEDLYLSSLRHYMENSGAKAVLTREPLGLSNIEAFLVMGQKCAGNKGCFIANSVREISVLPSPARALITENLERVRALIVQNVKAEKPRSDANTIADLIMTFSSGLNLQLNLGNPSSPLQKIRAFLKAMRDL